MKSNMQDQYCDISVGPYKSFMKNYNLKDIWREMHPEKLHYTYREISRLDKFLVSEYLTSYVQASNILHSGIKTDHEGVKILLNFEDKKGGLEGGN